MLSASSAPRSTPYGSRRFAGRSPHSRTVDPPRIDSRADRRPPGIDRGRPFRCGPDPCHWYATLLGEPQVIEGAALCRWSRHRPRNAGVTVGRVRDRPDEPAVDLVDRRLRVAGNHERREGDDAVVEVVAVAAGRAARVARRIVRLEDDRDEHRLLVVDPLL